MNDAPEKKVKTPFGEVTVRVKKGMPSHHNDPFIRKKMEEAEKTLRSLQIPSSQD